MQTHIHNRRSFASRNMLLVTVACGLVMAGCSAYSSTVDAIAGERSQPDPSASGPRRVPALNPGGVGKFTRNGIVEAAPQATESVKPAAPAAIAPAPVAETKPALPSNKEFSALPEEVRNDPLSTNPYDAYDDEGNLKPKGGEQAKAPAQGSEKSLGDTLFGWLKKDDIGELPAKEARKPIRGNPGAGSTEQTAIIAPLEVSPMPAPDHHAAQGHYAPPPMAEPDPNTLPPIVLTPPVPQADAEQQPRPSVMQQEPAPMQDSAAVELATVSVAQAPAAEVNTAEAKPEAAPAKSSGFFDSLFGSDEPETPPAPQAEAQIQPRHSVMQQEPAPMQDSAAVEPATVSVAQAPAAEVNTAEAKPEAAPAKSSGFFDSLFGSDEPETQPAPAAMQAEATPIHDGEYPKLTAVPERPARFDALRAEKKERLDAMVREGEMNAETQQQFNAEPTPMAEQSDNMVGASFAGSTTPALAEPAAAHNKAAAMPAPEPLPMPAHAAAPAPGEEVLLSGMTDPDAPVVNAAQVEQATSTDKGAPATAEEPEYITLPLPQPAPQQQPITTFAAEKPALPPAPADAEMLTPSEEPALVEFHPEAQAPVAMPQEAPSTPVLAEAPVLEEAPASVTVPLPEATAPEQYAQPEPQSAPALATQAPATITPPAPEPRYVGEMPPMEEQPANEAPVAAPAAVAMEEPIILTRPGSGSAGKAMLPESRYNARRANMPAHVHQTH